MEIPTTRYVNTVDGIHIAYQTVGDGPTDIVFTPGYVSNVDRAWDEGGHAGLFRELAALGRLIIFDRRGTGLSDRPDEVQSLALELGLNDLQAVLDAVASERPVLFGSEDGGILAAMFAAANPDRVSALVLWSPWVKGRRSADYPWAWSEDEQDEWDHQVEDGWGSEAFARQILKDSGAALDVAEDRHFVARFARYLRSCASPGAVLALERMQAQIDARPILATITTPTIILRRKGDTRSMEEARAVVGMIPGAKLIELSGKEDQPFLGDVHEMAKSIRNFVDGVRNEAQQIDRYLATILFTDVVGSTSRAASSGDRSWKEIMERHHAVVRAMLARYRGTEIDTAGDGFFATFDGPARAVTCARQIIQALEPTGLQIRAGVHTGEVQMINGKVGGLAVIIGARVGALAGPSEILVSRTVKDLVAGSGLAFEEAGVHELKGVPDRWPLYRAAAG
jgi:class 3 adenylate cyclase/alpha-beta hydrolase superfamily lysophospholipase